jgi:hypothetical protein
MRVIGGANRARNHDSRASICLDSNCMSAFSVQRGVYIDNFVRPGVRSLEI